MLLDWLLYITIFLEIGFVFWYLVMTITLLRSVLVENNNGLTLAMAFLNISGLLSSIWIIIALIVLPIEFIIVKLPLDVFKAVMITFFMWELDLKERFSQWRSRR